jgi:hypothetical protein
MSTVLLRSQGLLSFRTFSPSLQGRLGVPLASLIVRIDQWLTNRGRTKWSDDAIFAVFRKVAV